MTNGASTSGIRHLGYGATYGEVAQVLLAANFNEVGRGGRYRTWKHLDDPRCLTIRDAGTAAVLNKYIDRANERVQAITARKEG